MLFLHKDDNGFKKNQYLVGVCVIYRGGNVLSRRHTATAFAYITRMHSDRIRSMCTARSSISSFYELLTWPSIFSRAGKGFLREETD